MATIQKTVNVTDEQQTALNAVVARMNIEIDANNRRIQAEKDLAAAAGRVYDGPEPAPMTTLDELVQLRFDQIAANDVRERVRIVTQDLAETFVAADPETQAAMMQDMAKYRKPTPTTVGRNRPTRPR